MAHGGIALTTAPSNLPAKYALPVPVTVPSWPRGLSSKASDSYTEKHNNDSMELEDGYTYYTGFFKTPNQ